MRAFLLGGFAPFTADPPGLCDTSAFDDYENGPEFMADLADGEPARAVLSVLPAHPENDWADLLAVALVACAAGGRGAIAVVPDQKSLDRLEAALSARAPAGLFARLSSGGGAAQQVSRLCEGTAGAGSYCDWYTRGCVCAGGSPGAGGVLG